MGCLAHVDLILTLVVLVGAREDACLSYVGDTGCVPLEFEGISFLSKGYEGVLAATPAFTERSSSVMKFSLGMRFEDLPPSPTVIGCHEWDSLVEAFGAGTVSKIAGAHSNEAFEMFLRVCAEGRDEMVACGNEGDFGNLLVKATTSSVETLFREMISLSVAVRLQPHRILPVAAVDSRRRFELPCDLFRSLLVEGNPPISCWLLVFEVQRLNETLFAYLRRNEVRPDRSRTELDADMIYLAHRLPRSLARYAREGVPQIDSHSKNIMVDYIVFEGRLIPVYYVIDFGYGSKFDLENMTLVRWKLEKELNHLRHLYQEFKQIVSKEYQAHFDKLLECIPKASHAIGDFRHQEAFTYVFEVFDTCASSVLRETQFNTEVLLKMNVRDDMAKAAIETVAKERNEIAKERNEIAKERNEIAKERNEAEAGLKHLKASEARLRAEIAQSMMRLAEKIMGQTQADDDESF